MSQPGAAPPRLSQRGQLHWAAGATQRRALAGALLAAGAPGHPLKDTLPPKMCLGDGERVPGALGVPVGTLEPPLVASLDLQIGEGCTRRQCSAVLTNIFGRSQLVRIAPNQRQCGTQSRQPIPANGRTVCAFCSMDRTPGGMTSAPSGYTAARWTRRL